MRTRIKRNGSHHKKLTHSKNKRRRELFANKKIAIYYLVRLGYKVERITGTEFKISKPEEDIFVIINPVTWDFVVKSNKNEENENLKEGKIFGILRLNNFVDSIFKNKESNKEIETVENNYQFIRREK